LGLNAPIQDPKFYVSRLADKLKVYGKTEETAYKILKVAREARLVSGKDPASVAGAAYYTASVITGEERPITNKDKEVSTKNAEKQTKKITQEDISEILGVTEVTVRNRFKELERGLIFEVKL
jgi:transcription initiation factor TFIIB